MLESHECGEIHFVLAPNQEITYINKTMLQILGTKTEQDSWFRAIKTNPFFFLDEDDIPLFKACCQQASVSESPSYFKHHLYDRKLHRVKAHSWIRKISNSNEFLMVLILDREITKETRSSILQVVSHLYDDVFEIDKNTATVTIIRNLNIIGFAGEDSIGLWDFKSFLLAKLVCPEDHVDYISFLNILDANEASPNTTFEFRTKDNAGATRWLQATYLYFQHKELLLCFSDITSIKGAAGMEQRLKTDATTRIMNRETFEHLCSDYHEKKSFESTYNVLLLIEIDHFDTYSLDTQDFLLKETGRLLKSGLDQAAVCARFGDKKFIVCFHDLKDKKTAKKKIDRLYKHLHSQSKCEPLPTFSIGYAQCLHDPAKHYRCAYEFANAALLDAVKSDDNAIRDYDLLSSYGHSTRPPHDVRIQTFGYFEIFVDGIPVLFRSQKAKEFLAVLVDRRGGYVSSGDVINCLWEDEPVTQKTNARYRKVAMLLKNTLAEYGVDYIVETAGRQRRIISDAVDCDLYHFLEGKESYINHYDGTYMLNYSWSEWTASYLDNIKNAR